MVIGLITSQGWDNSSVVSHSGETPQGSCWHWTNRLTRLGLSFLFCQVGLRDLTALPCVRCCVCDGCISLAAWGRTGFLEMLDLVEEENFLSFFGLVLSWYWIWGVFISKALSNRTVIRKRSVYRRHKALHFKSWS